MRIEWNKANLQYVVASEVASLKSGARFTNSASALCGMGQAKAMALLAVLVGDYFVRPSSGWPTCLKLRSPLAVVGMVDPGRLAHRTHAARKRGTSLVLGRQAGVATDDCAMLSGRPLTILGSTLKPAMHTQSFELWAIAPRKAMRWRKATDSSPPAPWRNHGRQDPAEHTESGPCTPPQPSPTLLPGWRRMSLAPIVGRRLPSPNSVLLKMPAGPARRSVVMAGRLVKHSLMGRRALGPVCSRNCTAAPARIVAGTPRTGSPDS